MNLCKKNNDLQSQNVSMRNAQMLNTIAWKHKDAIVNWEARVKSLPENRAKPCKHNWNTCGLLIFQELPKIQMNTCQMKMRVSLLPKQEPPAQSHFIQTSVSISLKAQPTTNRITIVLQLSNFSRVIMHCNIWSFKLQATSSIQSPTSPYLKTKTPLISF